MKNILIFLFTIITSSSLYSQEVSLNPGAIFSECEHCPEMVVVPPGKFTMGYDGGVNEERYEGPPHEVQISYTFAIGKYEITNSQFKKFIDSTNYKPGTNCRMWTGKTVELVKGLDWRNPGYGKPIDDNEPVACVSWYDAKAYVEWLSDFSGKSYRLPSEAEWEYVARGGTDTLWAWGNDPDEGCKIANYYDQSAAGLRPWEPAKCDDGQRIIAKVGQLEPNIFGVYDIIGNVWEWAEDCYQVPYKNQPNDGKPFLISGKCEKRVVRGGAWHSRATWQKPSFRGRDTEDFVTQVFGIRVVRDIEN